MIFLNPAVLLGLIAASIPVIIHLLNLKKLKKLEFSSIVFLKELQKNKIKHIKIKHWILLIVRTLIILFIVLAFARPTVKSFSLAGSSSSAKTSAVFILDNSFSMSKIDSKGSLFNQAKDAIKEIMKKFQEGDEIALILTGNNSTYFSTVNSNLFMNKMENTNIGNVTATLFEPLNNAVNFLNKSSNINKEIYLLSDFQKSILSYENNKDVISRPTGKIKLFAIDYSPKESYNLSIDKLEVLSKIIEQNKPVEFSIVITNHSNKDVKNLVVSLSLNDERSSQASININRNSSKSITLSTTVKQNGYVEVAARLDEDDDFKEDNIRFAHFYIPPEIPVLICYNNVSEAKYLSLALTSASVESKIKITEKSFAQINSVNLSDYKLIIVIGNPNNSITNKLQLYYRNNGSLFLIPSNEVDIPSYENFLNAFDLNLKLSFIERKTGSNEFLTIDKIIFEHPVFLNIFSDKKNKKIDSPEIFRSLLINSVNSGTKIISYSNNASFLTEFKNKKNKLFLLSIPADLQWSNLPLKGIFVPLVYNSVLFLTTLQKPNREQLTGDKLTINVSEAKMPRIIVKLPDKNLEVIDNDKNSNVIFYSKTYVPGIYKFYSKEEPLEYVTVNVNKSESETQYASVEEQKKYFDNIKFKGTVFNVNKEMNILNLIQQARFGSELWKYFLIFALILALLEMIIAKSLKKDVTIKTIS